MEIAYRDDAVHITVRDDGAGRAAARGSPVPAAAVPAVTPPTVTAPAAMASATTARAAAAMAAATRSADEPPCGGPGAVSGFGLAGLRERVAMLGGEFEAGPDGAGGFGVSALLPAAPHGRGARPR